MVFEWSDLYQSPQVTYFSFIIAIVIVLVTGWIRFTAKGENDNLNPRLRSVRNKHPEIKNEGSNVREHTEEIDSFHAGNGEPAKLAKPSEMCPFAALANMADPSVVADKMEEQDEGSFAHIPSRIKKTEHAKIRKEIEAAMTAEERARERQVQQQQMREIFEMMEKNADCFGLSDRSAMEEQMKMYM